MDDMASGRDPARLLFERTDRFVCTLDLEGRFTSINPAGAAISGYSADELIGRFAIELIAPEQRELAAQRFAQRLAGDDERRDRIGPPAARRHAHPDLDRSTLIEEGGKSIGVLGIVSDVSERNRTSDALLESERRFHDSFVSASIGMALVANGRPFPRDQPRVLRAARVRRRDDDSRARSSRSRTRTTSRSTSTTFAARSPASSTRTRWRSATSAQTAARSG